MSARSPFQPFVLEVAEDVACSIATRDHLLVARNLVAVLDDGGYIAVIPISQIRRVVYRDADQAAA